MNALPRCIAVLSAAVLLGGCSIRHFAVNRLADALSAGGGVYASDDDVALVGAAIPFGLKLTESLLAATPDHRGLLLTLASGFTQYAYAYVELPAERLDTLDLVAADSERQRARRLYLRARDYGLRGIDASHAGVRRLLKTDPAAALASLNQRDVPLLYWTACAWGAAISLDKDNPYALADLVPMRQLAQRALALDDSFGAGALHTLFIQLAMSEPQPDIQRVASARAHLDRAVELSGGAQAAPYVSFAEAVCVPTGNRTEFDAMLNRALAVDAQSAPTQRLANELFMQRARTLRAHAAELFSD